MYRYRRLKCDVKAEAVCAGSPEAVRLLLEYQADILRPLKSWLRA